MTKQEDRLTAALEQLAAATSANAAAVEVLTKKVDSLETLTKKVDSIEKLAEATVSSADAIAGLTNKVDSIERGLADQAEGMKRSIDLQRKRAGEMEALARDIRGGGDAQARRP